MASIKKAREILGQEYATKTDEEIQKILDTLQLLADIAIDTFVKMTPEQRKAFTKNGGVKKNARHSESRK